MKKKMENVIAQNRMTSSKDRHLKDTIINMFSYQIRKLGQNIEE